MRNAGTATPPEEQPMFGRDHPTPPAKTVTNMLKCLPIGNVFHCCQINHSWEKLSEAVMEKQSDATAERFACKCEAIYPKILNKHIDLENALVV